MKLPALALLILLLPGICTAHDGRNAMELEDLKTAVMTALDAEDGPLMATKERIALLVETAAVESMLGQYNVPFRARGSYGVFQITATSAADSLAWLEKRDEETYSRIMKHYDISFEDEIVDKEGFKQNLEQNVVWSAAVAAIIYYRVARKAWTQPDKMRTRRDRARIWKKHYNTSLGKGTIGGYLDRCKQCLEQKEK